MREREEQKQREEEALAEALNAQQEEALSWQPPTDEVLQSYVEEARNTIQPLFSTKDQVVALAG